MDEKRLLSYKTELGLKEIWTEKNEENILNFLKEVLIQTSF